MDQKRYTLTPLTAVHIGTGEEVTPLDYKLANKIGDLDFKKPMYVKFSSDRILKRLIEEGREKDLTDFERASVKGNMKDLQEFFQNHCISIGDTDYPCDITAGFLKTYNANLNKDPLKNAAKVLQMYHIEGTPRPFIPGSSIKGSIRTALLNNYLDNLSNQDYQLLQRNFKQEKFPENYEKKLQKELLEYRDTKDDPFRTILIPDCPFKATGTQLVGGLKIVSFNKTAEELESVGTQIQAEVLKGVLLGGKNVVSELQMSINVDLQKIAFSVRQKVDTSKCIKTISFNDIITACNHFYWDEFLEEYNKFYKSVSDGTTDIIEKLKKELEQAVNTKGQCIIRIGRWSQVEFVTFETNFRSPKTPKIKGKQMGFGTTRTLLDYNGNYVPMGWCVIKEQQT